MIFLEPAWRADISADPAEATNRVYVKNEVLSKRYRVKSMATEVFERGDVVINVVLCSGVNGLTEVGVKTIGFRCCCKHRRRSKASIYLQLGLQENGLTNKLFLLRV